VEAELSRKVMWKLMRRTVKTMFPDHGSMRLPSRPTCRPHWGWQKTLKPRSGAERSASLGTCNAVPGDVVYQPGTPKEMQPAVKRLAPFPFDDDTVSASPRLTRHSSGNVAFYADIPTVGSGTVAVRSLEPESYINHETP